MAKFKTTTAILQILSLHCVDVIVVWNSSRKLQRRYIPQQNKKHSYHKTHHYYYRLLVMSFRRHLMVKAYLFCYDAR